MDFWQLEAMSEDMDMLYKSMKNVLEIVFASSPVLALSTHGWDWKSYHSTYLLRVSDALYFFLSLIHIQ